MNDATVMNKMVDLVGYLGYDRHIFQAGINNSQYNVATRVGWKYGASRYATGTPHILVSHIPGYYLFSDAVSTHLRTLVLLILSLFHADQPAPC